MFSIKKRKAMGCFMNILWLMFGGIITAVEYLIASLLDDVHHYCIPWHADLENGKFYLYSAKRFVAGNVPTVASMC